MCRGRLLELDSKLKFLIKNLISPQREARQAAENAWERNGREALSDRQSLTERESPLGPKLKRRREKAPDDFGAKQDRGELEESKPGESAQKKEGIKVAQKRFFSGVERGPDTAAETRGS